MGLLDRLDLLIRSELNQRKRSDNTRELDGTLAEMEGALREARRDMASVFKDEARLEKEVDVCLQEEARWEDRAMEALRVKDEVLARKALVEQQQVARRRRALQEDLRKQRAYIADLEKALEALEHKMDATRSRKRVSTERARESNTKPKREAPRREPQREERREERREPREEPRRERPRRSPDAWRQRSYPQISEDQRRWEAMMERRSGRPRRDPIAHTRTAAFEAETGALGALDDKLQEFSRFEDKINRLEAEAEATRTLEAPASSGPYARSSSYGSTAAPFEMDEDDPLYDPKLADLERQFRELEQDQQLGRLKKRVEDED